MQNLTSSPPDAPQETPTPTKTNPQLEDARAFEQTLRGWREDQRGRLAQLKRNVGEPLPGRGVSWFYGTLYNGNTKIRLARADEYFLVATIFDLNRFPPDFGVLHERSLGASMRQAVARGANEDSTGRRLQILLDADYEEEFGKDGRISNLATSELAFRLRQTVQWLAGQQVGVDFAHLLADLCNWVPSQKYIAKYGDRRVQKKWAREFYNVRPFQPTP